MQGRYIFEIKAGTQCVYGLRAYPEPFDGRRSISESEH